jgi:hypothetical protein
MEEIYRAIEKYQKEQERNPPNPEAKQIHIRGANISFNSYDTLATKILEGLNIDKLKLTPAKTVPVQMESTEAHSRGKKSKTRKIRFSTDTEEQIGFVAELICYHKLVQRYGEANVNWISENAYRAYPNKFMTREAGMGYDIALNDHGKPRYIEVKGSANIGAGIRMSSQEMQKALKFSEWYDLIIVLNPLSDEPILKYIRGPFKFKKNESLFSNNKLTVFNENYIIKFTLDQ